MSIKTYIQFHPTLRLFQKYSKYTFFPEILRFAENSGYKIILAEHQNWYPDLTFVHKENDAIMFALDLKTTFRRNNKSAGFTLGSHGTYFKDREKSKNIQFPYNNYIEHYCLGIIYTRVDFDDNLAETDILQVNELEEKYRTANDLTCRKTDYQNRKS